MTLVLDVHVLKPLLSLHRVRTSQKKLLHERLAYPGQHSRISSLFQHLSPNSGLFRTRGNPGYRLRVSKFLRLNSGSQVKFPVGRG